MHGTWNNCNGLVRKNGWATSTVSSFNQGWSWRWGNSSEYKNFTFHAFTARHLQTSRLKIFVSVFDHFQSKQHWVNISIWLTLGKYFHNLARTFSFIASISIISWTASYSYNVHVLLNFCVHNYLSYQFIFVDYCKWIHLHSTDGWQVRGNSKMQNPISWTHVVRNKRETRSILLRSGINQVLKEKFKQIN